MGNFDITANTSNTFSFIVTDDVTVMPYITLGVTGGVVTQVVPSADDGVSLPINVQFPFGSQIQSSVYVGCRLNVLCIFENEFYILHTGRDKWLFYI